MNKVLIGLVLCTLCIGIVWYYSNKNNPEPIRLLSNGTSVQVPVIAYDRANGGNPVAGVQVTALIGSNVVSSVWTAGNVIDAEQVKMTLTVGQTYTFRIVSYGATLNVNMAMLNVAGDWLIIEINSAQGSVTDVMFRYPVGLMP